MEPIESSEVFEEDPGLMIEEQDDGSVIVELEAEGVEVTDSTFGDNLAQDIPASTRLQVAGELIELVEKDKESRKKRQEQYEEGIRRTGLGDDAPGGAQFNGASKVVHPLLAEACVDFEARAIKELMPAGGPVRTSITSDEDAEKLELANVKRDILNLQLTRKIPEYRDELESLLSQLPMGGSQYMKVWYDGKRKRTEFIPVDHVFIPFNITNFYTSPRVTQQQFITRQEFEARQRSGLYLDVDTLASPPNGELDRSIVDVANDKVEGREDNDAYNDDGLREVYEIYLDRDFSEWDPLASESPAPYIVHVDVYSTELLGLYRNWDEADPLFERLHWIVDWGFIPWRGAYKLGLPHLIGGLSAAATGALRALLDSALAANAPTLLKLKAGRMVGQTTEVAITQVQEIEGPTGIDDIRKVVTPIPFAGPNPILFQLLGFVVDSAKGVVSTAEEKIADASSTMPVGTSLALIEQGSKVFSAIHMRLHQSQARVLEILCRLNAKYPEEESWSELLGRPVDSSIFEHSDDIAPISDPNIFSEAQRFAQMQAVMQLANDPTIPYNRVEVHRRMLRLLNVPDLNGILPETPHPKKIDAVQENMAAVMGVPLKAYPDQDHMAHMEVHLRFILNPVFGAGPALPGQPLGVILQHCTEHLMAIYPQLIAQGQAQALVSGQMLPDAPQDRQYAVGAALTDQTAKSLEPVLQMLTMAQQIVQKKTPPPPMDPQAQVTLKVAEMEDARAKAEMSAKQKLDETTAMGKIQREAAEFEAEQAAKQHDQRLDALRLQMEDRADELSRQVDMMKNDADNRQKQMTELLKNRDDNQTQVIIAQLKAELDSLKQVQAAPAEVPQQDGMMLREMQRLLGELKEAKTNQALETVVAGLQAVIQGQQGHQERMLSMASQLMASE